MGSMLRSSNDSCLRTPRDQISRPLGLILAPLGPHVGPMLAPCWRPSGVLKLPWSFLERSKGYLLPMFDQHGTEDKEKRLHYCKKHSKTIVHFQILVLVTFFAPGPCLHFLVRCPWSLVFGPWALVPGSCCLVLGPSVFDPWLLAPASCSLVLGPWRLLPGPCCLVLGAWSVVPGPRS